MWLVPLSVRALDPAQLVTQYVTRVEMLPLEKLGPGLPKNLTLKLLRYRARWLSVINTSNDFNWFTHLC